MPFRVPLPSPISGIRRCRNHPRKIAALVVLLSAGLVWFYQALPDPLFDDPTATVIEDRDGRLLAARIAADQQWRFPARDRVPEKFSRALICLEDKRFHRHPGVDPLALARAIVQNLRAGRVESGASTLTMQVIRLSRKGQPRTLWEKAIEATLAIRLECSVDKDRILALYAGHAPFGGNVVGLDAAAWRYFGRRADNLSWAEAATLAVLPNNPALIHPGRNRDRLRAKRDRLLHRLHETGAFDALTLELAKAEGLPPAPFPLPMQASHLLHRVHAEYPRGKRVRTTLDGKLQGQTIEILARFHRRLVTNGVHNGAALVLDNRTGRVLAYVGNTNRQDTLVGDGEDHGHAVDIVPAARSTGSLLKPFLFATALDEGLILPQSLLPDIPTNYGSYQPQNFDHAYRGAVPADLALARSLNIPAVRLQERLGTVRLHHQLKRMGLTHLTRPPSHYGLALILGGAESSMWELAGRYAGLARTLNSYGASGTYRADDFAPPKIEVVQAEPELQGSSARAPYLSAGAIWHTLEALTKVDRPDSQGLWQYFTSARRIAWKTGTSFGFRDAWAIGVTPDHTVAVWVGNADGEGRPGLTGVTTAAPIMFELFAKLPRGRHWFSRPDGDLNPVAVCIQSGDRAGMHCPETRERQVPRAGLRVRACRYHQLVHLDAEGRYRVHGDCASPSDMQHRAWFVLPPGQEWFFKRHNPSYRVLPPFHDRCKSGVTERKHAMELIYPRETTKIYIPRELDGQLGKAVFEVAHRHPDTRIFWHLDDRFLGMTHHFHQMALQPKKGKHRLVLVDEAGERLER